MIIEINKDNYQKEVLESKGNVIIDFYANWCGPCRMLRPILEEVARENPNLKIVSINVDEEKSLTKEYLMSTLRSIERVNTRLLPF